MRVEVVMTYFIQGQNQKSMFIKLHVSDDNNEVKKKETIENDITHEKKSKNDETEVKSNGKRIRKANRNINGRVEYDQYNPNLKKGENNIWKGRGRKLLQTSSILTPILLKIGDMVDVAFDDINRYCKSKSRNRRS